MRNREFLRRVDAYGVGRPDTQNGDFWRKLLDLPPSGSGFPREYTTNHVRVVVAWQMLLGFCGKHRDMSLHHDAAREMAEHESGWLVLTEQTVNWTRHPTARVFDDGAVCIPVPSWLDSERPFA